MMKYNCLPTWFPGAAERLLADDRTCWLVIDVEIASRVPELGSPFIDHFSNNLNVNVTRHEISGYDWLNSWPTYSSWAKIAPVRPYGVELSMCEINSSISLSLYTNRLSTGPNISYVNERRMCKQREDNSSMSATEKDRMKSYCKVFSWGSSTVFPRL